ncbi:hypothetical protein [Brevibacillus fortis]|uniref:hypothetical protein n=1 Tax=Brevibacillus fortis TaxID=2126352 RepID=UPI0038FCDF7D
MTYHILKDVGERGIPLSLDLGERPQVVLFTGPEWKMQEGPGWDSVKFDDGPGWGMKATGPDWGLNLDGGPGWQMYGPPEGGGSPLVVGPPDGWGKGILLH